MVPFFVPEVTVIIPPLDDGIVSLTVPGKFYRPEVCFHESDKVTVLFCDYFRKITNPD
jgi:hypothetical protein